MPDATGIPGRVSAQALAAAIMVRNTAAAVRFPTRSRRRRCRRDNGFACAPLMIRPPPSSLLLLLLFVAAQPPLIGDGTQTAGDVAACADAGKVGRAGSRCGSLHDGGDVFDGQGEVSFVAAEQAGCVYGASLS